MPDVVRWADLALEDDHENLWDTLHGYLLLVGYSSPAILKISLPQIMDLFLKHDKCQSLMGMFVINDERPYDAHFKCLYYLHHNY